MIKNILELLALSKHYGQSENIEIAKGKYEIPTTLAKGIKQFKRIWQRKK